MPLSVHALQKQCLEGIPTFRFCLVPGSVAVWTCSFMTDKHIVPIANGMAPGKKQQPSGRRGSCDQPWRWNIWAPISWLCWVARKHQLPRRVGDHGRGTLLAMCLRQRSTYFVGGFPSRQRISHPCWSFFLLNSRKNHLQGNEREA